MSEPRRILLGIITGAQGIRGEVVVKSFAEIAEDVAAYGPLASEDGRRTFTLQVVRVADKGVIARVAGVKDRNAAEALKGTKLFVDRSVLPAPEPGEYYFEDLAGLAAMNPAGEKIGSVKAAHDFGAGSILEVELANGKTEMLPFTDAVVPEVDIANGRVVVVMPATTEAREEDEAN
jgi:16S rRNA processing protein RimM